MRERQARRILGIGEVLWDCFGDQRTPGGAPANVVFHATQLGLEGLLCSRTGADEAGDALVRHLGGCGVDVSLVQRDPAHPTGTVTVKVDAAGQPRYVLPEGVAWDHLEFDEAWRHAAERAAAVCFGTLAQRSERSRATIHATLECSSGALHVYDVNVRLPHLELDWVQASLERADVVKLNESEVAFLAPLVQQAPAGNSGPGLVEFSRRLVEQYRLDVAVVTRGQDGCLAVSRDEMVDLSGEPVEVADTVGAGDAFTAGLVYGLLEEWELECAVSLANRMGALVASRRGAMPVLREEFAVLERELTPRR